MNSMHTQAALRNDNQVHHSYHRYSELVLPALLQSKVKSLTRHPLFTGWTIDRESAMWLANMVYIKKPERILELGGGISTLVIALVIEYLGLPTQLVSVDQSKEFSDKTRLQAEELFSNVQIEFAIVGIKDYSVDDVSMGCYDLGKDFLYQRFGQKIDLVFVDGPATFSLKNKGTSRIGTLPQVLPFCSDTTLIMLDDAHRKREQKVLARWEERGWYTHYKTIDTKSGLAVGFANN